MAHGDVQCSKCGEVAHTKCPSQRNIFPEDQLATLYSNMISVEQTTSDYPEGSMGYEAGHKRETTEISITLFRHDSDEEIVEWLKKMASAPAETLRKAICNHDWRWVSSSDCLFGCHKGVKSKKAVAK